MAAAFARDGGGYGAPASVIDIGASHPDYVVVPDGQFLFAADFHRDGPDLILTGHDGQHEIIPGYFATEHRPALIAPNGARLSPHLVELLAGSPTPNQYAQARPAPTPPDSIGKVEKIVGNVTVIRNGVSVALNAGDAVYKNDVIQTGVDSKAGIGFPDGTALQLLANTRMALDEYSYDPNGHSNSALFSYISGTFGFFAGKVAHTGDMKIDTPVATLGIRGTTGVMGQGTDPTGHAFYWQSIYDDPGTNVSGAWDDFGKNPDGTTVVEITVSQPGEMTVFTLQGPGLPPLITVIPLPASFGQIGQEIVEELAEIIQELNVNPHSLGAPGSPENPLEILPPENLPGIPGNGPQPIYYIPIAPPGGGPPIIIPIIGPPISPPGPGTQTGFIWPSGEGTWDTAFGWLGDQVPIAPIDTVTIESGTVQYGSSGSDTYTIGNLIIDSPGELEILSGTLDIQNGLDDDGILIVEDPPGFSQALTVSGPVAVGSDTDPHARLIARSDGSLIDLIEADVQNYGTIAARHGGYVEFMDDMLVTNESGGKIKSVGCGSIVDFSGMTEFDNAGAVRAKDGGGIFFIGSLVTNDESGIIAAVGYGSMIEFKDDAKLFNDGAVIAKYDGIVVFDDVRVRNESGGIIEAGCQGTVVIADTTVRNTGGTIEAIGACAVVALVDSTIRGGTLTTGSPFCAFDGVIEVVATCGDGVTIFDGSDHRVTNDGFVQVDPGANLELIGTIVNDGRIDIDEGFFGADLLIDGTVTLKGDGVVTLDGACDAILAGLGGDELDNYSNIVGAGRIGGCSLTLVNEKSGIIDADIRRVTLVLDTGVGVRNAIANAGTLESTRGGILKIRSDVDNAGGTIGAFGAGSLTELIGVTITGGTLATGDPYWLDAGVIAIVALGCEVLSVWDGSRSEPITLEGFAQVDPGAELELKGDIDNNGGTIDVDQGIVHGYFAGSNLLIDGLVTLSGDGAVALEGNCTGIVAACGGGTLDNESYIYGSRGGYIGTGNDALTFDNSGTVNSEAGDAGPLVINTGCIWIINTGTLEATAGSELDIYSNVNNTNGTIEASAEGITSSSTVVKLFDVTIQGGTLVTDDPTSSAGGIIEVTADGTSVFDGSTQKVTVDGYVQVDAGADLELIGKVVDEGGKIDNQGTIDINGGSSGADLVIHETVKLSGGGSVTLDDSGDQITGAGAIAVLDNVNDTISGAGTISVPTVENNGTIKVDASDLLTITGNVTGTGNLDIGAKATLELAGTATNVVTFLDPHGTLQIDSSGTSSPFSIEGGGDMLPKGDVIYLPNIAFDGGADSYNSTSDMITVGNGLGASVTIDVVGGIGSGDSFIFKQLGTGTEVFDPPVTIGGAGDDNFFFHHGLGGESATSNPWHDNAAFENSAHTEMVQQLQSLVGSEANHAAFMDFAHHDSIALPGAATGQFHAMVHTAVDLH
jgi:FecR protein